jgi:putative ABC transport system substrate-binding protein
MKRIQIGRELMGVGAALILWAHFAPLAAGEAKKIGILIFSEESRYKEATNGILDELRSAGYGEPAAAFVVEHAGASKARAAELVRTFASAKMDLIFSLGTSMTIPVAREIKDVPIVFSVVYDPVDAGIVKDWKSSGNNTTGTSTRLPIARMLDVLASFSEVNRLAVLYTPGEKNSETQLKDLQAGRADRSIQIIPVPLSLKEDIAQILPEVVRTSDALYLTGSNLVDSQVAMIVDMATRKQVVTITHLEDLVEKGVLIGVCADSYTLGRLAGKKAVNVLQGAKPSSLPIETLKELDVILNRTTAEAGRFPISASFRKSVTRVVE